MGAKTIVHPAPVWVIGTYDSSGKPNVADIAWGGICCSKPPCVAISLRKATYSHGNIVARKAFTVNVPSEKYLKEVDYFGMVSGRDNDKFSETGLTSMKSDLVDAPYVKEYSPRIRRGIMGSGNTLGRHFLSGRDSVKLYRGF